MHRLALVLAIFFAVPAHGAVFRQEEAYHNVKARLQAEDNRALADEAFDAMFRRAALIMRSQGYNKAADDLMGEWTKTYKGSLLRNDDVGDHAPLSIWVAAWYEAMRILLGDRAMELSHLQDIWVLNFTIPVVFSPYQNTVWCQENEEKNATDSCEMEYLRHFAGTKWQRETDPYADEYQHYGFAPVVTYWCIFATCEAALWGSDASLICGSAAAACEIGTARYLAPRLGDEIWKRKNPEAPSLLLHAPGASGSR